jgi:hypothetical protein
MAAMSLGAATALGGDESLISCCEFIQGLGPSAVHFNRNSDQPRDSMAAQEVQIGDLFVWVLVCIAEKNRVTMPLRFIFDTAY